VASCRPNRRRVHGRLPSRHARTQTTLGRLTTTTASLGRKRGESCSGLKTEAMTSHRTSDHFFI
jgi:hypothetical protein